MKLIIYILPLMLLCLPAIAAEIPTANTTGSVIVSYPDNMLQNITVNNASQVAVQYASKEVNVSTIGRRITQGGCVVPGETIDIAGIGWYTGTISYYGKYYDDYTEENNVSIQAVYHPQGRELSHLYLDPQFFGSRLGYWYTMYDVSGGSGNDRLFKVSTSCVPTIEENTTNSREQYNETAELIAFAKNLTLLPVKTEDGIDYIFSKQSVTTIDAPNSSIKRWIFGRVTPDTFYDTNIANGRNTFSVKELEPGNYDVVYINPGANGIIEEVYDSKTKNIISPFKDNHDTPLYGIQPRVAETLLGYAVKNSKDDTTATEKIDVQDPSILIIRLNRNAISVGQNNITAFTLSGYTNANQGTTVNIQLDSDRSVSGRLAMAPWTADVINNGGQVAYRAWTKSFLLDTGAMWKGQHSFTVTNKEGASATVPFYVYQEPAANYVPNASLSYIGNSPFVPTPTPEVIVKPEVQVKTVTQVVTVPVTPSQESVDAASQKALVNVVVITIAGIILVIIIVYVLTIGIRVVRDRRKE